MLTVEILQFQVLRSIPQLNSLNSPVISTLTPSLLSLPSTANSQLTISILILVKVKITLLTGGLPSFSSPWCQALLRPRTRDLLFLLNPCGNSPYVTSSLMRKWVGLLWICFACVPRYIGPGRTQRKTPSLKNTFIVRRCPGDVFTEQLPRNASSFSWLLYTSNSIPHYNM
jgi:hypothetical protein